jgi:hypothetical protein
LNIILFFYINKIMISDSSVDKLYKFIESNCKKYNIDESHGLKHSMGTVKWAEKLMDGLDDISDDEYDMIIYSAALHDMCDSKYRDISEACDEIWTWLKSQHWSIQKCDALINIITSMSYTKLKNRKIEGQPFAYPNHGKYQRAYHIVRHADLLEAYRVVRCYLYSKHRLPHNSEDEIWAETERIIKERVLHYVSDGWIFLERALIHIPQLEAEALRCLRERDTSYVL